MATLLAGSELEHVRVHTMRERKAGSHVLLQQGLFGLLDVLDQSSVHVLLQLLAFLGGFLLLCFVGSEELLFLGLLCLLLASEELVFYLGYIYSIDWDHGACRDCVLVVDALDWNAVDLEGSSH